MTWIVPSCFAQGLEDYPFARPSEGESFMAVRIVTARQRADLNLPKTVSEPSLLVDRDRANMACWGAHYKVVV